MDINRAKQEIKNTVRAYLAKNEDGTYRIPSVQQRPVLLMGPPGIGKTAIMEQVANECGIALVSYTITHHTRQSAIGLPFISKRSYGGREYTITEYTMSEIIASVYDKMEETGLKEGILFIDEINCVSETLAPTMLQFLQRKSFGSHFVPEGWIIAAAGNPPEYNKSVRDFDIVTLDRLKRIDVTENLDVWKPYAYRRQIHPAILSYLDVKKQNFYIVETTVDGKAFVTARGWEDLSSLLQTYEELAIPVAEDVVREYLQHPTIARDFAVYYDLFCKYQSDYHVDNILEGNMPQSSLERLKNAPFDERVSVIGLLIGKLTNRFAELYFTELTIRTLYDSLRYCKTMLGREPITELLEREADNIRTSLATRKKASVVEPKEARALEKAASTLIAFRKQVSASGKPEDEFVVLSEQFSALTEELEQNTERASQALEAAFAFLATAFGKSQEMVVFVTELNTDFYSTEFIAENGSEAYSRYNKDLMIGRQRRELLGDIDKVKVFLQGL